VTPEAYEGGPIGLVEDGDTITIDVKQHTIEMNVSLKDLELRRSRWNQPSPKATRGTLYKYIQSVSSASLGCITDDAGKSSG
jgi:dihydroxy-acid dehydratase